MGYGSYLVLAPVFTGITLYVIVMVSGYRKEPLGQALLWFLTGVLGFLISSYIEQLAVSVQWIQFFASLEHLFLPMISVAWLMFAWIYTGYKDEFTLRHSLIFCIIPLMDFLGCATNSLHHQYYHSLGIVDLSGMVIIQPEYGPIFWATSLYIYGLFFTGILYLVRGYIIGDSFYRKQALWIIIGFLFPMVVNLIYIFKIFPFFRKDYTPVAFAVTGFFFYLSVYWERLLKMSPLSRNIILRDIQVGVITLNSRKEIIDYNQLAGHIAGITPDDLGAGIFSLDIGKALGEEQLDLTNGPVKRFSTTFDGRVLDVQLSTSGASGKISAYLIILYDITQRNQLLEKLEDTNVQLIEMQNQLVQQKKLAIIGQMAAGVAHEINNPVSFVKSNQLMLSRYLLRLEEVCRESEQNHQVLMKIQELNNESEEGMNRITNVVQNLLSFSRLDDHGKKEPYHLNQEIEKAVLLLGHRIRQRIRIEYFFGEVPEISCFGSEINQVILNLLTNSVQSIPDDSIGQITIHTGQRKGHIFLEITDNGSPIPAKIKEHLFDPFFTTKSGGQGTGLGLSLSKDIIEKRHKGSLYLKDSKEKIFCLEIPVIGP